MMLGGVGFQAGVDKARLEHRASRAPAAPGPDVVEQLKGLKALHDDGALSPEEFRMAKSKVLGG